MNSNNKISIFAENAVASVEQQSSSSIGYYYPDSTWASLQKRGTGAYEGIAYSIEYNTGLRQATFMSAVLAEIMAVRNEQSGAYQYMNTNGIGTTYIQSQEGDLETHASNLANIFYKTNFILENEVVTSKIDDKAVTTAKIDDYAITNIKLGNVLGTKTATTNGLTVTLSQTNDKGSISINLTGSSTNSDKLKIQTSSSKMYLSGSSETSGYQDHYVNSNVYMQSGNLYSTNNISTGYMQALYFNSTSDIRKKYDIYPINHESVKEIIENTDILHFKYNSTNKDCIGIIAQTVINYDIDNFKIAELGPDGYYTVSESKLVYILWDYIKQLEKRVKELEK